MLRRAYAACRARVAEAEQEVVEMRRELAMRPVQTVVRLENLDKEIVDGALQDRDDAYRRRDVAMGALSDVRLLHHKDRDDKNRCACKALYAKCEMAQIADRWEGISSGSNRRERHFLKRDHLRGLAATQ